MGAEGTTPPEEGRAESEGGGTGEEGRGQQREQRAEGSGGKMNLWNHEDHQHVAVQPLHHGLTCDPVLPPSIPIPPAYLLLHGHEVFLHVPKLRDAWRHLLLLLLLVHALLQLLELVAQRLDLALVLLDQRLLVEDLATTNRQQGLI